MKRLIVALSLWVAGCGRHQQPDVQPRLDKLACAEATAAGLHYRLDPLTGAWIGPQGNLALTMNHGELAVIIRTTPGIPPSSEAQLDSAQIYRRCGRAA